MKTLLCALGISDEETLRPFFPRVRDREDVAVLRCQRSGVFLLSRTDHMDKSHYEGRQDLSYWKGEDRISALAATATDDRRRARDFRNDIAGKVWLDVGTGMGGVLELLGPEAGAVLAVEPQSRARQELQSLGYEIFPDIGGVVRRDIEVVSLFHVLEHLLEPVETLKTLRKLMVPGAKILIEVPHARDFLIVDLACRAFMEFTFWSEHLILHTRESLRAFLEAAGFEDVVVSGFQRYPLASHLHWLAKGKPGGHIHWQDFGTPELDRAYTAFLQGKDRTDTLIASARA